MISVQTKNFGARDISLAINGNTVLAAPSESGKSTALNAVKFLVLGYVPQQGKQHDATARFMRSDSMTVTGVLDDGRAFERNLSRKGTKLTLATKVSWQPDATNDEASAAILALFGPSEAVVSQLLDPRALLELTGPQRSTRIEQLIASSADASVLMRRVAALTVASLAGLRQPPADMKAFMASKTLPDAITAELKASGPNLKAYLTRGLAEAIQWARDEKLKYHRELETQKKALQVQEARRAGLAPAEPVEIELLDADRSRLEQELGAIKERNAEPERRRSAIGEAKRTLEMARQRYDAAKETRETYEKDAKASSTKMQRLQAIEAELAGLVEPIAPDESAVLEIEKRVAALLETVETFEVPALPSADAAKAHAERLGNQLAEINKSPWPEVASLAQDIRDTINDAPVQIRLSLIDVVIPKTERLVAIALASLKVDPDELREQHRQALAAVEASLSAIARAEKTRSEAQRHRNELNAEACDLRKQAAKQRKELTEQFTAATRQYESGRRALSTERDRLKMSCDGLASRDKGTAGVLGGAGDTLTNAEMRVKELGAMPEVVDPTPTENALARVRERAAQLQACANTYRECERLRAVVSEREAAWKVYSATEAACATVRDERTADNSGPIVQLMTKFLAAAGRKERPYFDRGGEIGWIDAAGNKVQVSVLSGLGWTFYTSALMAAMTAREGGELRLLPVEAAEVESGWDGRPDALMGLLCGISVLAGDLKGCAIVNVPRPIDEVPAGWTIVSSMEGGNG